MENSEELVQQEANSQLYQVENWYEGKARAQMFATGDFSDVSFLVGTAAREYKAHRFALITASFKFKEMFDLHSDFEKPILIPEIEPYVFEQLLR